MVKSSQFSQSRIVLFIQTVEDCFMYKITATVKQVRRVAYSYIPT